MFVFFLFCDGVCFVCLFVLAWGWLFGFFWHYILRQKEDTRGDKDF